MRMERAPEASDAVGGSSSSHFQPLTCSDGYLVRLCQGDVEGVPGCHIPQCHGAPPLFLSCAFCHEAGESVTLTNTPSGVLTVLTVTNVPFWLILTFAEPRGCGIGRDGAL